LWTNLRITPCKSLGTTWGANKPPVIPKMIPDENLTKFKLFQLLAAQDPQSTALTITDEFKL